MKKTDKELWQEARAGRRTATFLEGAPGYEKKGYVPSTPNKVNIASHYVDDGREPNDESQVLTGGY